MEMQVQSHYWTRRAPDWQAAVVAGLAAAAVLMVLELVWSASVGDAGPWNVSRKIAAILMGPEVLQSSAFGLAPVALALVTHYALGVFSGVVIGIIIAGFHWETSVGMMLAIGAAVGSVIYVVNFHALAQFYSWFVDLRGWDTFIGHLVFGMSAALIYWKLSRRVSES